MKFSEKTFEIFKYVKGVRNDYIWYTSDTYPDIRLTAIYMNNNLSNAIMTYDTDKVIVSMMIWLHPDRESPENIRFIYKDEDEIFEEERDAIRKVREIEDEIRANLEELIRQSNNGEYDYDQVG